MESVTKQNRPNANHAAPKIQIAVAKAARRIVVAARQKDKVVGVTQELQKDVAQVIILNQLVKYEHQ